MAGSEGSAKAVEGDEESRRALVLAGSLTTDSLLARIAFGRAVESLLGHRADVTEHLEESLAADPGLAAAWILRSFALRMLGRRDLLPEVEAGLQAVEESRRERGLNARESALLESISLWCRQKPIEAAARLDTWLRGHPDDLLVTKLAHALHFILGDLNRMRSSIESVCQNTSAELSGAGYLQGMLAFALEEAGDFEGAEKAGRLGLEKEPRDVWGIHALAHVFFERGQHRMGLNWLAEREYRLAGVNNFAGHVAWHEALFALELGEAERALGLYDARIQVYPPRDYRDLSNSVSLLLQLETLGLDVGDRWRAPLATARERRGDHVSLFADVHHLAALVFAGEEGEDEAFAASMSRAYEAEPETHDAILGREVGHPLASFLLAAGQGKMEVCRRMRAEFAQRLIRVGGSRAQRRVIGWVLNRADLQGERN